MGKQPLLRADAAEAAASKPLPDIEMQTEAKPLTEPLHVERQKLDAATVPNEPTKSMDEAIKAGNQRTIGRVERVINRKTRPRLRRRFGGRDPRGRGAQQDRYYPRRDSYRRPLGRRFYPSSRLIDRSSNRRFKDSSGRITVEPAPRKSGRHLQELEVESGRRDKLIRKSDAIELVAEALGIDPSDSKKKGVKSDVQKDIESLKKGIRHLKKMGEKQTREFREQLAQKDAQIKSLLGNLQNSNAQTSPFMSGFGGNNLQHAAPPVPQQPGIVQEAEMDVGNTAQKRHCIVVVKRKDGTKAAQFKLGYKGETTADSLKRAVAQHMQVDQDRYTWFRNAEGEARGEFTLLMM